MEHILELASSGLVEEVEGFVITANIDVDDENVEMLMMKVLKLMFGQDLGAEVSLMFAVII